MRAEIYAIKEIKRQIDHILANYGSDSTELKYKLECLILEWVEKGFNRD